MYIMLNCDYRYSGSALGLSGGAGASWSEAASAGLNYADFVRELLPLEDSWAATAGMDSWSYR